jgi:tripartite-type tricarboxylate transporter receptor subunit TctC
MKLKSVLGICFLVVFTFASGTCGAQEPWPSRSVTIVVPFAAGGVSDVTTRMLAAKLRTEFEQAFVIENRAGAGGNIGAEFVAKASPDGYTLLQGTSAHVTNVSLYKNLAYDFIKDFAPVSQISSVPSVLVVHPSMPVKDLAEFIKYAKDTKTPLNYGSGGSGSVLHLAAAVFDKRVGTRMIQVPYKGNAPALTDLLGGQIQLVFSPVIDALSHINAGRLKPLGVTTKVRSPLLPNLTAIAELLPGYEVVLWNGIFAPAGTPPAIVDKLSGAIRKIIQQPETKKFLADLGSEPVSSTPQEFKKFVSEELPKWRALVETAGARVE